MTHREAVVLAKLGMWLDLALIFLIALIGVGMFVNSFSIPPGFRQVLGAGAYPRIVAVVLMVLCVAYLLAQLPRLKGEGKASTEGSPMLRDLQVAKRQLLGTWIAFIVYLVLIPVTGFFEAAFVFLVADIFVLGDLNRKWLLRSVILSAAISVGLFIVFRVFLHVYLPQRMLFRG